MLRIKFLFLSIISSLFILTSCSDTGNDPVGPDDEEPIESSASITNPGDGASLEGEITFTIEGEAENGFDEARIFVGDEQVETVDNPSLPYEQNIATYDYNNGEYDLSAELDVTDEDTTIEASISATLENYMVTLETDQYIEALNQRTYLEAEYMFVADPEGNIIRTIDLTSRNDGTIQLLPPRSFEESAPSQYNITMSRLNKYDSPDGTFEQFNLSTYVGLESWSRIYMYGNTSGQGSEEPDTKEITFNLSNHPNIPMISETEDPLGPVFGIGYNGEVSQRTLPVRDDAEELLLTTYPEDPSITPKYYREQNVQDSLANSDSLRYNVSEDFQEWDVADVSIPSNVEITQYSNVISAKPDTWEEGRYGLFPNVAGFKDENDNSTELGMLVLDWSDHLYQTTISGAGDAGVGYRQQTYGDLPSEFVALDADLQLNSRSMNDLQLDISGSFDYMQMFVASNGQSHSHSWAVYVPDTMETFVYPKIADSLGQDVNNYNRSEFELVDVTMNEIEEIENFTQLLTDQFGPESARSGMERVSSYSKRIRLNNQEKRPVSVMESLYGPKQNKKSQVIEPQGSSKDAFETNIPKSLQRR